jgi:alpha-L-fucosidase
VLDLGTPQTFDVIRLREYLPLGQRVGAFAVDAWQENSWREIARGTAIGSQRLIRTGATTTSKVRLRITEASACPAIAEVALFALAPATEP